ncbi:MAG: sporulation initiation factor Spo0A C-terminal domain-containing protein [Oscillospiraceae bacterium]|nr:sporulation initiation factor Spo0A C-terminal domain-containing protein [Oscillospiraceae bacterium]
MSIQSENQNDKKLEEAAIRFVQQIGIRSNRRGYHYLITAIVCSVRNPQLLHALTGALYPEVAEHYGITPFAVERGIRSAIERAESEDPEKLHSVFYYKRQKPYISELLTIAHTQISLSKTEE